MIEVNLITSGGIAAVIAVVVQLLVKPALRGYESQAWHSLAINAVAAVLGIAAAFVGGIISGAAWNASSVALTAVTGLFGGLLAVGGYEGVKNIIDATQKPQ